MTRKFFRGLPFLLFLLTACSNNAAKPAAAGSKGDGQAPAKKQEGQVDPKGIEAPKSDAKKVSLSPANTKIEFTGTKEKPFPGKHDGDFKQFTGSITNPSADLMNSVINLDVDVASLETDFPDVTNHLKTADFFNVKFHPRATFVSTKIEPGPTVVGALKINGITKEISFPAKVELDGKAFKLQSAFSINRLDFNMMYQPNAVHNAVAIRVNVDAPLVQAAP